MLILKGFAVYEEAAVVVEMEGVGTPVRGRLRSGRAGPQWVVGVTAWRNRWSELGWGNKMGLASGWYGGVEAVCIGTNRMTGEVRGRGVRSG